MLRLYITRSRGSINIIRPVVARGAVQQKHVFARFVVIWLAAVVSGFFILYVVNAVLAISGGMLLDIYDLLHESAIAPASAF